MSINVRFGRALQHVRLRRGVTQEDFSVVSSRTYVSTLERGLKSPTLEKVEALAKRLDIHPLTLIALAYAGNDGPKADALLAGAKLELDEFVSVDGLQRPAVTAADKGRKR